MTDELDATSPAQLHALSHATRIRLWRELGADGATISQLAHRLPTNKGNVAHHLAVLVDAGLARKGRTRTVRGGTEQYYERTTRRVHFGPGDEGGVTQALLDSVAAEIGRTGEPLLHHRVLRLTRPQAVTLARHLESVVAGLEPAAEPETSYGVLVSVYPRG